MGLILAHGLMFYLEAAIVRAEFLSQHCVIGVKGFLLHAAVHQHVNNLPLLLVLQAHPSTPHKDKTLTEFTARSRYSTFNYCRLLEAGAHGIATIPEQLFKGVQVIFTGHDNTEDVSPDLGVHPLFPCQLQDTSTKLKSRRNT